MKLVIGLYKAPASYTGEDVVEISCHGSPFIQNNILYVLAKLGARAELKQANLHSVHF